MTHALLLILIALATVTAAEAQRRPNLVPQAWTQDLADPETRTRRFVSPDGRSRMVTRETVANRAALNREMDVIAYRSDEEITYQRRATSWIAVSGYRNDKIFSRWHHIELEYPREQKLQMDATVTYIARGMTTYGEDCGSERRK